MNALGISLALVRSEDGNEETRYRYILMPMRVSKSDAHTTVGFSIIWPPWPNYAEVDEMLPRFFALDCCRVQGSLTPD
jgi:hypothetical protein